jgi:hypothetical protein
MEMTEEEKQNLLEKENQDLILKTLDQDQKIEDLKKEIKDLQDDILPD